MQDDARGVVEWTRRELGAAQIEFLKGLPLTEERDGRLYAHANAWAPSGWEYVTGPVEAARSIRATPCRITFCGHVHEPILYHMTAAGRVLAFQPVPGTGIPLGPSRRWLAIPGSAGQPRDGNPAACYALLDDARDVLTYFRVPYDHETAARKVRAAGLPESLGLRLRRWRGLGAEPEEARSAADRLARAPILMVAVDVAAESAALAEELRLAARRILQTESGARLACVTVLKTSRIGMDIQVDEEGRNLHVRRLIELKHWARPLNISPAKITFHVLSAPDPGAAIIEFARANHVDQIVIGSRGSSTLRRFLGSVSSQVVAQADCTVTVVKAGAVHAGHESETGGPQAAS